MEFTYPAINEFIKKIQITDDVNVRLSQVVVNKQNDTRFAQMLSEAEQLMKERRPSQNLLIGGTGPAKVTTLRTETQIIKDFDDFARIITVIPRGKFFRDKTEFRRFTINPDTYWEVLTPKRQIDQKLFKAFAHCEKKYQSM